MRVDPSLIACLVTTLAATNCRAFVAPRWGVASPSSSSSTRLFISSWGTKGPPSRWANTAEQENPEERPQAYLPAPVPVITRPSESLSGACLVSGAVNAKERTDQFLFDLLNHEESSFRFSKIIAFCNDKTFAKKRLLSRSARYTGLLDKLDFLQAAQPDALPTTSDLEGVQTWLAYLPPSTGGGTSILEAIRQVCQTAQNAPSVLNLSILVSEDLAFNMFTSTSYAGNEREQLVQLLESLRTNKPSLSYTVVITANLDDKRPEGQRAYQMVNVANTTALQTRLLDPTNATLTSMTFSREEAYRMATELLQLDSGMNQVVVMQDVLQPNATAAKLVRGLREAGYDRVQEIDHVLRQGVENYTMAIEAWKTRNPDWDKGYTTDIWWEQDIFKEATQRRLDREKAKEDEVKDARTLEIENIAREWARREFYRQSMEGTLSDPNMSQEDYTTAVWDRAMFEADLKYRQMNGEATDEENELATFEAQQERKKQTMLLKAKKELQAVLDEADSDKPSKDDDQDK